MKVFQLIERLRSLPPYAAVCFPTDDQHGLVEIVDTLELIPIKRSDNLPGQWILDHDGDEGDNAVLLG